LFVFVELGSENLFHSIFLPIIEGLLFVAAAEFVFVLLLFSGHRYPLVLSLLVEIGPLFLLEPPLFLLYGL